MTFRTMIHESTCTIYPPETFNFPLHRQFRKLNQEHMGNVSIRKLHIDLSGTKYLDTAAIGMLLLLEQQTSSSGHELKITGASGMAAELLELAELHKRMRSGPALAKITKA